MFVWYDVCGCCCVVVLFAVLLVVDGLCVCCCCLLCVYICIYGFFDVFLFDDVAWLFVVF